MEACSDTHSHWCHTLPWGVASRPAAPHLGRLITGLLGAGGRFKSRLGSWRGLPLLPTWAPSREQAWHSLWAVGITGCQGHMQPLERWWPQNMPRVKFLFISPFSWTSNICSQRSAPSHSGLSCGDDVWVPNNIHIASSVATGCLSMCQLTLCTGNVRLGPCHQSTAP